MLLLNRVVGLVLRVHHRHHPRRANPRSHGNRLAIAVNERLSLRVHTHGNLHHLVREHGKRRFGDVPTLAQGPVQQADVA